ncbi:hypothetical protein FTO74_01925 [Granulicella sp. WH15]|uniref:hypothetical protein n=1 Tax=Granulicella sp. WH15 TaxID=2602070 RepID=UPI0013670A87|nr:hypothetical protein [Granulicella sp. WH15]QHN02268.1 hypothetical protein FTO74_01925 [Granulicella sp. WH15]
MSIEYDSFESASRIGNPIEGQAEGRDDSNTIRSAINASRMMNGAAISATVANRTHRIVRERANILRARRSKVRSLWIPSLVCASLLMAVCVAVWTVLDEYEIAPSGIPDASQQLLVQMMWSLPLSAALLAWVWFRRSNGQAGDEGRNPR